MKVYHLKACDTCRKAIKALEEAGHAPTLVDVRADGVSGAELSKFIDIFGVDKLVNTRSTTWRGLSEAEKSDLTPASALTLLRAHPTLMKRPVITDGVRHTLGWRKDAQAEWTD